MWCKKRVDILNRLGMAYECDGQTERRVDRLPLAMERYDPR